jgi:hypothetical protein
MVNGMHGTKTNHKEPKPKRKKKLAAAPMTHKNACRGAAADAIGVATQWHVGMSLSIDADWTACSCTFVLTVAL